MFCLSARKVTLREPKRIDAVPRTDQAHGDFVRDGGIAVAHTVKREQKRVRIGCGLRIRHGTDAEQTEKVAEPFRRKAREHLAKPFGKSGGRGHPATVKATVDHREERGAVPFFRGKDEPCVRLFLAPFAEDGTAAQRLPRTEIRLAATERRGGERQIICRQGIVFFKVACIAGHGVKIAVFRGAGKIEFRSLGIGRQIFARGKVGRIAHLSLRDTE